MPQVIDRNSVDRMATAFLVDHAGLAPDRVSHLLGVTPLELDRILAGKGAPPGEPVRRINALAATQSLLLSGYTPSSAARWMREEPVSHDGRTAVEVLSDGAPEAIGIVLMGAYERMAS